MTQSQRVRMVILWGGVLMGMALSACHRNGSSHDEKSRQVRAVRLSTVQSVVSDREGHVSGVVSGRHEALLTSRVGGRVKRILVRLGERVRKGQILVELSGGAREASVQAADADLEEARSHFRRIDSLYKTQSATKSEWDRARRALDVARSRAAGAQSVLARSLVRAPFPGVVARKSVRKGDVVAIGSPLVEVVQNRGFQVVAHIPAQWSKSVHIGQRVSFLIHEHAGSRTLPVVVREVGAGSDPVSYTVPVRADVQKGFGEGLWSGEYGTMEIPVGHEQVVLIPVSSILDRDGLKEVFVVENGKAFLRYIRSGRVKGEQIEVLSGVSSGESVVVSPPGDLENGTAVRAEGRS
ncbi:MAG: efflux RND transporter periplasmic adaptor subunit [Leptospirales bacterium]